MGRRIRNGNGGVGLMVTMECDEGFDDEIDGARDLRIRELGASG